jgi:hypothetical protein
MRNPPLLIAILLIVAGIVNFVDVVWLPSRWNRQKSTFDQPSFSFSVLAEERPPITQTLLADPGALVYPLQRILSFLGWGSF